MAARWYPIPTAAHSALTTSATFAGPRVTIGDRLGPDVWPLVKTVLEKLGAVYVINTSAFDFEADQDARTLVTQALAAGRVMSAATSDGFVATPAELAQELASWHGELSAPRGRSLRVLEPSAGTGRFVQAIRERLGAEWCHITAVEPDARRARQIPTDEATTVHTEPFEAFAARARAAGETFDRVIMNPPFSVPGRPNIWAEHLLAAWDLLAPGGRLVAIVPASVLDRRRSGLVGQAAALVYANADEVEELPRDAFAESGIVFPTAVISLDRPVVDAPDFTPPPVVFPCMFRAYTGAEVPVPVTRPMLTRAAAEAMPVQVWRDGWRGGHERVLRFRAMCLTCCDRPVWGFDDGENDPRGALGDASAGFSLDPYEYGREGMPIGLCALCGNDGRTLNRAEVIASEMWHAADKLRAQTLAGPTPAPAEVSNAPVQPSLWGELAETLLSL